MERGYTPVVGSESCSSSFSKDPAGNQSSGEEITVICPPGALAEALKAAALNSRLRGPVDVNMRKWYSNSSTPILGYLQAAHQPTCLPACLVSGVVVPFHQDMRDGVGDGVAGDGTDLDGRRAEHQHRPARGLPERVLAGGVTRSGCLGEWGQHRAFFCGFRGKRHDDSWLLCTEAVCISRRRNVAMTAGRSRRWHVRTTIEDWPAFGTRGEVPESSRRATCERSIVASCYCMMK